MKPVFQTQFGDPDGNCWQACVASILECEIADLPDFRDLPKGRNWLEWFNEQIQHTGFGVFNAPASAEAPFIGYIPEGVPFIVSGPNTRDGLKHCVIMRSNGGKADLRDELVHDPIRGGTGITHATSISLVLKR